MDPIDSAGIAGQGVSFLLAWSSGRTQVESYLGASRNSLIPQARFSSIAGPMVWVCTYRPVRMGDDKQQCVMPHVCVIMYVHSMFLFLMWPSSRAHCMGSFAVACVCIHEH